MKLSVLLVMLFAVIPELASAQDSLTVAADTGCIQKDLGDVVRSALHKPPKSKAEGSLLIVPVIGSNPATGFIFGVSGLWAFKMPGSNIYSNFTGTAQVTSKSQIIFMLRNSIYTRNESIFLTGDWRYLKYSQSTYGLGTTAPEGGILDYQYSLAGSETTEDSLAQPMKFNFARLHQYVTFRLKRGLYAGFGYTFDGYSNIIDEKLNLQPGDTFLTSHYAYNTKYGFSTTDYSSAAINATLIFDTRDNMLEPWKGIYAMVGWRGIFQFLGNTHNGNFFQAEWRSYHSLSSANPRHLLAFWAFGNFSRAGQLPYLVLPAHAYDQRGRSGRGYTQGRFRGPNLVYGEAEYRYPLGCHGVLSGVAFLNATTTDNPALDLKLFESIKAGYGAGLRIRIDKQSRTSLAVDLGFGQKSFGFYLAASETF
jgi:outer membrane protein assembly factor BamA